MQLLFLFALCLDKLDCKANENEQNDGEHINDNSHGDKPASKPSKLDASKNESSSDDDEIVGLDGDYSHSVSDKNFEIANVTTTCVDLDDLNNNGTCEAKPFESTDRPIHGHPDLECDKPARLSMEADSKETHSPLKLGNIHTFTMLGY